MLNLFGYVGKNTYLCIKKMSMNKRKKENLLYRYAMLDIIGVCIYNLKNKGEAIYLDGYDTDNDRVHFINEKHKCVLYGVKAVDYDNGTITFLVLTKLNGVKDIYEVTLDIMTFKCDTLKRIAYEIYDYVKTADDIDFEQYAKEMVAGWIDTNWDKF